MSGPEPKPHPPNTAHRLVRMRWPLLVLALALLASLVWVWTWRGVARVAERADARVGQAGRALGGIAKRFRTGTITETFTAALPELASPGSGNLEVATAHVVETFTRADEQRVLWDWVSLGQTVVEIRTPVTYRYHLKLDDRWELDVSDHSCIVRAPPLRASLPPAIHTEGMEKRTQSGWLRFDTAERLAELERDVTPILERYAVDPRHLGLAREEARRTVAAFVRGWLLREDHWREDRFRAITVIFDGEQDGEQPRGPTILLDE